MHPHSRALSPAQALLTPSPGRCVLLSSVRISDKLRLVSHQAIDFVVLVRSCLLCNSATSRIPRRRTSSIPPDTILIKPDACVTTFPSPDVIMSREVSVLNSAILPPRAQPQAYCLAFSDPPSAPTSFIGCRHTGFLPLATDVLSLPARRAKH
ncbi:hypothetical protein GY45DRAFT_683876 [Cubamyces sp. BRFM 1775]|nr:hypothetical protein GY45DRAFT_683876 [Cubamyces sp. BRFM 1775]